MTPNPLDSTNTLFLNHNHEEGGETCSCHLFGRRSADEQQPAWNKRPPGSSIPDPAASSAADAELAKEMNALSVEERERVYEDVHGVVSSSSNKEESFEFIQKLVEEMDVHIQQQSKSKRKAYERAIFFKPTIKKDLKLKLLWLRACEYDSEKAALRILKHFKDKLELFGEARLVKDITLSDLSEDDMEVFSRGFTLELPHKDQVGRPILTFDPTRYDFDRPNSVVSTTQVSATLIDWIINLWVCHHRFPSLTLLIFSPPPVTLCVVLSHDNDYE